LGWVWVGLGQLFGELGLVWVDEMDPRTTLYGIQDAVTLARDAYILGLY